MSDKTTKQQLSKALPRRESTAFDSDSAIESRISEVAKAVGGNSSLARMAEVSESVVRKWVNGESEPTTSNLVAVARAGGVTVEWLATGVGPKRPGEMVSAEDYLAVPLYDVRSVASCNALFDAAPAEFSMLVPRPWPSEQASTASMQLAFIRMHGDAMEPTLYNGDLLLIDRADLTVSDGIYVFFVDGFMFIQRLRRRPDGVECFLEKDLAANPAPLPNFEDHEERSGLVGRVVWFGRHF